jgi:hypothetical protein
MRIENGRSDWLADIEVEWCLIGLGGYNAYAPCVYGVMDYPDKTQVKFRLGLKTSFPYPEPKRNTPLPHELEMNHESIPNRIRMALEALGRDEIAPYIFVHERDSLVNAITIKTFAEGRLDNLDGFRDSVVRKLLRTV